MKTILSPSRSWHSLFFLLLIQVLFSACSPTRISTVTPPFSIADSVVFRSAHLGICIYDPVQKAYLAEYQADKYFVPASNTKIPTCYAAMKYLGDSLIGMRYLEGDTAMYLFPTGDPTFLHPDFTVHPVFRELKKHSKRFYIVNNAWDDEPWGSGWSWNDYEQYYMVERNSFPVYGNVLQWVQEKEPGDEFATIYSIPEVDWEINFTAQSVPNFRVERDIARNRFTLFEGKEQHRALSVPFVTAGVSTTAELLRDTLFEWVDVFPSNRVVPVTGTPQVIHSQSTDSVLRIMMHRSDNFFAEQLLLMTARQLTGLMATSRAVDSILRSDFRELPSAPRWADGSGLSRYNLFTPRDFVMILDKMRTEFGMERIRTIFPTGGEGTLRNYYQSDSAAIYAKTGTLSGVVALSGFLITDSGRTLIFSTLVNNHRSDVTTIRKTIERYLQDIRRRY
jgi:D-alanyl-D-alanine carboxypeptidase/D-alanyl-D-alanine-endopeptidase (penicillin-binding protein 4)